jgi:hypothetical protein
MSALPLCTLCLRVRISSLSSPNCRLLAVGCKLHLPPKTSPATFASPVKPKSFICNAYKKQGVGGEGEAGAMPPLPLCLCVRISSISSPNCRLSAVSCKLPLPLSPSPATLASRAEDKSFVRNAYKKHGGEGLPSNICPPFPASAINVLLSTFDSGQPAATHQPRNTDHGSRITGHGPRLHEPANL